MDGSKDFVLPIKTVRHLTPSDKCGMCYLTGTDKQMQMLACSCFFCRMTSLA